MAMTATRTLRPPRPLLVDDADARDAQIAIGRLAEQADTHRLRLLASLYGHAAEMAYTDAAVLDAADRLKAAARARDGVYRTADLEALARLKVGGVEVFDVDPPDDAAGLRRHAATLLRLSREAREAAEAMHSRAPARA
jgi:hypothetical protein